MHHPGCPPRQAFPADLSYPWPVPIRPSPRARASSLARRVVAGCGAGAAASFDPTGACTADGSAPGAYPDLEALIPTTYEGKAPERLDSGRNCTPENLAACRRGHRRGPLRRRHVGVRRRARGRAGRVHGPGPDGRRVADFYATSARTASRTTITGESTPTSPAGPATGSTRRPASGCRPWSSGRPRPPDRVNVVITNDLPDPKIQAAVDGLRRPTDGRAGRC